MAKFIFENTKRKVLFLVAKIDFWGQNGVRALEPSDLEDGNLDRVGLGWECCRSLPVYLSERF